MSALAEYRKAIAAGVLAAGTGIGIAAADGAITGGEWWVILGSTLVGLAGVWAIPNSPTVSATNAQPVTVAQKDDTGTTVSMVVVPGPTATTVNSGFAGSTVSVTNPGGTSGQLRDLGIREPEGD